MMLCIGIVLGLVAGAVGVWLFVVLSFPRP